MNINPLKKKRGIISTSNNIDPDEIFLDSQNLPGFDTDQFEGRIERPITKRTIIILGVFFTFLAFIFIGKAWDLQIIHGEANLDRSIRNSLRYALIFADRGNIYSSDDKPLAWNNQRQSDDEFSKREYVKDLGISSLLGYVTYPKKDSAGFYYDEEIAGVDGLESIYDDYLAGENGLRIIEINALNEIVIQSTTDRPENGKDVHLTIDSEIQKAFMESIENIINQSGFAGGGGVIMDVRTGDLISLVSYPEYDSNVLTLAEDDEKIYEYLDDTRNPFLHRITEGLYTPGSIMKPFIALAALEEGVISPYKEILSTKEMVVPNPYDPDNPSYFSDWKAHGLVNVRRAIAISSNIYFYQVGGGFEGQEGLGISRIEEYLRKFGFGQEVNVEGFNNQAGTIPNPGWKMEIFDDDWRLGDTYFTAIGQYGVQVTPIQVARAISSIANGGKLVEPRIVTNFKLGSDIKKEIDISSENFEIVQEGMRESVQYGTAKGLSYPDFEIAAKTGTAELGITKEKVNSWVTGFFPYDNPKYAFVIFLEKGDRSNLIGGVAAARGFFDWAKINRPDFLE